MPACLAVITGSVGAELDLASGAVLDLGEEPAVRTQIVCCCRVLDSHCT